MDSCIGCGDELIPAIDADPNGDMDCKCARCQAEEEHDFDAEPNVMFTRRGEPVEKPSKIQMQPTAERIEQLLTDGSPITPADFPPQHDGKRFHVRWFGREYQVYGIGVLHVCLCPDARRANMVADALEMAAG